MPNDTKVPQSSPSFWAFHPIGRGIGSAFVYNAIEIGAEKGFVYGALSGAINVAIRPMVKSITTTASPEIKAAAYIGVATVPWVASYGIMHLLAKTGQTFFKLNPKAAIITAAVVEVIGSANKDFLEPK